MPTYISLIRFTQQGREKVKEHPDRLDQAKDLYRSMGAELKAFYLLLGQYDMLVVADAPDEETVAKLALAIGEAGDSYSESCRAFTEDEYLRIVSALP
jgi:uncharacterized protein with GYD domain